MSAAKKIGKFYNGDMEMKKLWCCVKSGLPILLRISSVENN